MTKLIKLLQNVNILFLKMAFPLLLLIVSCSQKKGPEDVLRKYVEYRFGVFQTKAAILAQTTGKLKQYISSLENNELDSFMQVGRVKKKTFKIKLKKCSEGVCFITYIVKYKQLKENKTSFEVAVKKIAELRLVDGEKWKIYDVNNLKTFIDSKEVISP